jgi:hypothetical protein
MIYFISKQSMRMSATAECLSQWIKYIIKQVLKYLL